eukprot:COSAG06_NODE_14194_length_1180_cov_1.606846_1_plen_219_part_10
MTLSIAPLQRQAVRATAAVCRPSVFFFLLLLFVQYLPPFLQRDADPFGLRRACNSTLVTSLAPSVFLHSRRGGLVYTVLGRRARRPRRSLSRGCYRCARADPQRLARSRRLLVTPALAVPILRARALTSGGDGSRPARTKVKSRHFLCTREPWTLPREGHHTCGPRVMALGGGKGGSSEGRTVQEWQAYCSLRSYITLAYCAPLGAAGCGTGAPLAVPS